jgi:uncharacterized protein (DUF1501 family)
MPSSRREFLGIAGLSFVSLGAWAPRLLAQAAQAAEAADRTDGVLVVVELTGGNDGLNTVIPFENDLYHRNRRMLRIPKDSVHRLTDQVGLHPALELLSELHKDGRLAIVQGVGYPQPDRSHFRSMEIWHTASIAKVPPETGWLGRTLDQTSEPTRAGDLPGLALTASLPQACLAQKLVIPVVGQLEAFTNAEQLEQKEVALRRKLSTSSTDARRPVQFLRSQAATVYQTVDKLKAAAEKYKSNTEYPGSALGQQLKRAAQILAGNFGVRIMYVSQDGYDTHANQAEQHTALLGDLAGSLAAFDRDLSGLGLADRVAIMVFSEFGRRVEENASAGTDHGAASCLFIAGAKVNGRLFGEYPQLDKLDEGDLIYNTDFRSVYAAVLDHWLGCDSAKVLGGEYPKLKLFS